MRKDRNKDTEKEVWFVVPCVASLGSDHTPVSVIQTAAERHCFSPFIITENRTLPRAGAPPQPIWPFATFLHVSWVCVPLLALCLTEVVRFTPKRLCEDWFVLLWNEPRSDARGEPGRGLLSAQAAGVLESHLRDSWKAGDLSESIHSPAQESQGKAGSSNVSWASPGLKFWVINVAAYLALRWLEKCCFLTASPAVWGSTDRDRGLSPILDFIGLLSWMWVLTRIP